jgi:hypothetical protein
MRVRGRAYAKKLWGDSEREEMCGHEAGMPGLGIITLGVQGIGVSERTCSEICIAEKGICRAR